MKKLLFLTLLLCLVTACVRMQQEAVFTKLNYNSEWEEIPNVAEVKKHFLDMTGYDFDEQKILCRYYLDYLYGKPQPSFDIVQRCFKIKFEKITYKNYGEPMSCKRGDFVKAIIEEGSSWLLEKKWSDKVHRNWFWDKYNPKYYNDFDDYFKKSLLVGGLLLPYINDSLFLMPDAIYSKDNNPVCYAVSDFYEFMLLDKKRYQYAKNLPPIKMIEWDTDITQSQNPYKEKHWLDKIIEVDFNNDGKKELIHIVMLYSENTNRNEDYLTIYSKNIDLVKEALKQPNLVIKDIEDFANIAKKFDNENRGYDLFNCDGENRGYFFNNAEFFEFKNKIYIHHTQNKKIYLIEKNKCNIVCNIDSISYLKDKLTLPHNIIKALAAKSMTLQHANEDVYLYDESFADEIKYMAKEVAPYSEEGKTIAKQIETYLKQKVKELCNTDLNKFFSKHKEIPKFKNIVKNIEIPDETYHCSNAKEEQPCIFYIMNHTDKEVEARELYHLVSKITGVEEAYIQSSNILYASTVIKPQYYAQILVPPKASR